MWDIPFLLWNSQETPEGGKPATWQVGTINLVALGKSIKVVMCKLHKQMVTRESFELKWIL